MFYNQCKRMYQKFVRNNARDSDKLPYRHYLGRRLFASFAYVKDLMLHMVIDPTFAESVKKYGDPFIPKKRKTKIK